MFVFHILLWIVIGGLAGWIAEKVMKFDTGLMMNIVLGIAGSVVGNAVLRLLGFWSGGGIVPQLIVAILGACLLIYIFRLLNQQKA